VIEKNPAYGIRRIKKALENKGIIVGRDVLGHLLKIWSINLKRKISKHKRSLLQEILIKLKEDVNLLKKEEINEPFECITTDITKIEYKGGTAYLNVHKDYYGQMVYGLGFAISHEN
ncbi:MAG: hypothetical protein WCJ19_05325, partial [bacterium]